MRKRVKITEKIAFIFLGITAMVTLVSLLVIVVHVLKEGLPHLSFNYLLDSPRNMGKDGGIFPTIVGTFWLLITSLFLAVPVGVGAAIYLNEYTKKGLLVRIIHYFTANLAGIPSIVFGLFGFAFFVVHLKFRWSILSGGLTLALMVLPTIIRTAEEALAAVPDSYREGSLALGVTKWQTIKKVVLPTASSGIITGVILGMGRIVGETAAVYLTVGGALHLPTNIMQPCRPMTLHLYTLAGEGISLSGAYTTATVLLIGILVLTVIAQIVGNSFSPWNSGKKGRYNNG